MCERVNEENVQERWVQPKSLIDFSEIYLKSLHLSLVKTPHLTVYTLKAGTQV